MNTADRHGSPEHLVLRGEYSHTGNWHRILEHHRIGGRCVRVTIHWSPAGATDSHATAEILTTGIGWAPLWTCPDDWWRPVPDRLADARQRIEQVAFAIFGELTRLLGTSYYS
ncbi:hypothetical protein [Longispora albida]|uniref:hypothetical protein n=1 Tax=Longispora albida TaxID=203523 RepID=UPI0003663513|nr:hypothetical protein [Longispora albida]